jgi:drug/metabolite transporter (DMT)-like permease
MSRLPTWALFALAVLIWGTTWYAIVFQIDHGSPEFGVALRFALAGALALGLARAGGERFAPPRAAWGLLLLQGVFMYGLSYLCVYHAEHHVPSGLVAVGYSASPLLAGIGAWALWRTPLGGRFLAGGALGVAGVALIFWPEVTGSGQRPTAATGLAFTAAAVALSAVGALAASRNRQHGLSFWSAMGWSMLVGAAVAAAVLVVQTLGAAAPGAAPAWPRWPTAWTWWLALAYLSVAGTVVAFAAFLTLQQRLGPGPASTVGVMTPVVALAVSTAFEGYRPDVFTLAGALLAVWGNVWMLRPRPLPQSAVSPGASRAAG